MKMFVEMSGGVHSGGEFQSIFYRECRGKLSGVGVRISCIKVSTRSGYDLFHSD